MSGQYELGGYRLERLLGRGTMGSVYLARPDDGADIQVAIKRVPSLGTEDDRSRLRREAETMASLDHPNIVEVLDVVDDGDGIALVMPFAEGGTLADRIESRKSLQTRRAMTSNDVCTTLAPIADALAYAHRQGVLHRDVKPSNILFSSTGDPLLADFGIARNAAHTNLTNTNMAMGTAAYLDPDLADGMAPSPASDQYALGVVAYEALTGSPPFDATTSPLAVLKAADRGTHDVLDPATFGPLALIIERAFARDRHDRFASMEELATALRQPDEYRPPDVYRPPDGYGPPSAPPVDRRHEPGEPHDLDAAHGTLDATRAFRRRVGPISLAEATPVIPANTRRRYTLIGGLICALIIAGVGVILNSRRSTAVKTLGPQPFPRCNVQTTAQCVKSVVRTAKGIQVVFENDSRGSYAIGETSDAFVVGNWFCGSRATLALYRPRTGVIYYFNNWPDPDGEPTTALVDSTGIKGAQIGAGDYNGDSCADVALDVDGVRTWFLPHTQPRRLRKGPPATPPTLTADTAGVSS